MNFESFSQAFSTEALTKLTPLHPAVARHLFRVYALLGGMVAVAAAGAVAHAVYNVGGLLTFLGSMGVLVWLMMTPAHQTEKRLRLALGFAALIGATLGPVLVAVFEIEPMLLVQALLGTTALFACFSGAALFAQKRMYIFVLGLISTVTSFLGMFALFYLFMRSPVMDSLYLYGGLLVFAGMVIVDTQLIVERAEAGMRDVVSDALTLFQDALRLFIRILVILTRKHEEKNKDKGKSR